MPGAENAHILLGALAGAAVAGGLASYVAWRFVQARTRDMESLRESQHTLQRRLLEARSQADALKASDAIKEELMLFYVVTLPELVRHLASNREKRHVAPFLLQMLDVVFRPGRICIFYKSSKRDTFKLAAQKGLSAAVGGGDLEVGIRDDAIGWVASQKRVMTSQDVNRVVVVPRDDIQKADLYAPMIDPDADSTLGIITISGLSKNIPYAPRLLKMVGDLGSLALMNTEYFRFIQSRANEDGLTGLLTKRFGLEKLALAMHEAEVRNGDLSVLILDVDHFKAYNDTRGHLAGDKVLRRLGELVREGIRADDFAIRFGGEEFIVVFLGADKRGAMLAAEKIRRRIEEEAIPFQGGPGGGRVTITGGVASFRTDSRSSMGLIDKADQALYAAKQAGRNRVLPFRVEYLDGGLEPDPLEPSREAEAQSRSGTKSFPG